MSKTFSQPLLLMTALLFPPALPAAGPDTDTGAVIIHYADLAHASFRDSLDTARQLQAKVNALITDPTPQTHQAAKDAWLTARQAYGQTEAFRFGNPNVDDWEGQVNAWPLDEGLIDYVEQDSYKHEDGNAFASANVIAGTEAITPALLRSLQEKGGSEANVGTGYHAVEFLLWGQDLNQTPQQSGSRPHTDFAGGAACTHGNCERRARYLKVATGLLVSDLAHMAADWSAESKGNYRQQFLALEPREALRRMLFGMGSLSLGELAGERMNVALLAHSQEDEHSCFSDNTHNDIDTNIRGIRNIYTGSYVRNDGSSLEGPSLARLLEQQDAALAGTLMERLDASRNAAQAIVDAAGQGEAFDQQIVPENAAGNQRIRTAINALRAQTIALEAAATALGIGQLNAETSTTFSN